MHQDVRGDENIEHGLHEIRAICLRFDKGFDFSFKLIDRHRSCYERRYSSTTVGSSNDHTAGMVETPTDRIQQRTHNGWIIRARCRQFNDLSRRHRQSAFQSFIIDQMLAVRSGHDGGVASQGSNRSTHSLGEHLREGKLDWRRLVRVQHDIPAPRNRRAQCHERFGDLNRLIFSFGVLAEFDETVCTGTDAKLGQII